MSDSDNYQLLFGAHADAVRHAFPASPPLWDRETRHRTMAVLDAAAEPDALPWPSPPDSLSAFRETFQVEYGVVRPVYRRLTARPLPRRAYVQLTRTLIEQPKTARALTHFPSLGRRRLAIAAVLPPELVSPPFMALVPSPADAKTLAEVFAHLERVGLSRAALAQTLRRCKTKGEVREKLSAAFVPKQLRTAPWAGDERLRPVESVAELKRLGREFQNCMKRMAERWAVDQDTAVYRYDGRSPAVCALEFETPFGWRVEQIKGPKNTTPPKAVLEDIRARFAKAGIRHGHALSLIIACWG